MFATVDQRIACNFAAAPKVSATECVMSSLGSCCYYNWATDSSTFQLVTAIAICAHLTSFFSAAICR